MNRSRCLQELLIMRFEEVYEGWEQGRLTQIEAALILGVSDRTFRRYLVDYKAEGLQGLIDSRIGQISHRRAPVDEIMALTDLYKKYYVGWNIRHFFKFYKEKHDGQRGYTWVKSTLQNEGMVEKGKLKGVHRKKRERAALKGMMLHQDASSHQWVKVDPKD